MYSVCRSTGVPKVSLASSPILSFKIKLLTILCKPIYKILKAVALHIDRFRIKRLPSKKTRGLKKERERETVRSATHCQKYRESGRKSVGMDCAAVTWCIIRTMLQ
jgi:hypothetical protein